MCTRFTHAHRCSSSRVVGGRWWLSFCLHQVHSWVREKNTKEAAANGFCKAGLFPSNRNIFRYFDSAVLNEPIETGDSAPHHADRGPWLGTSHYWGPTAATGIIRPANTSPVPTVLAIPAPARTADKRFTDRKPRTVPPNSSRVPHTKTISNRKEKRRYPSYARRQQLQQWTNRSCRNVLRIWWRRKSWSRRNCHGRLQRVNWRRCRRGMPCYCLMTTKCHGHRGPYGTARPGPSPKFVT